STNAIAVYIIMMSLLSIVAAMLLQDIPRRPLGIDYQEEQEHYARLRLGKVESYAGTHKLADAHADQAAPANPDDLERVTT
ncbi:MAG: MFS transporter, partial [Corynebacterium casei]